MLCVKKNSDCVKNKGLWSVLLKYLNVLAMKLCPKYWQRVCGRVSMFHVDPKRAQTN